MNKTIGNRLKEKRLELKLSLERVSDDLKIRPEFLKAIEDDNYSVFSSDIYAKGFIKSYSKYLGLDSNTFTAVYRRDIESTKLNTNKKRSTTEQESSAKTIYINREKFKYIIFFLFALFIIFGTLTLLNRAFEPPMLEIYTPHSLIAGDTTEIDYYEKTTRVTGATNPNTVIKINSIVLPTRTDNTFESDLFPVTEDSNRFLIEAISNVGVVSRIELTLNKKTNIIEQSSGINGALQVTKDNSFIKIYVDDVEIVNGIYFENDSIPVIGKDHVTFETDTPENLKIILNGVEYKIVGPILKLRLTDKALVEYN